MAPNPPAPVKPSSSDDTDWAQIKDHINFLNKERTAQKEAYDELSAQIKALLEEKERGAEDIMKKQIAKLENRMINRPLKLAEPEKFDGTRSKLRGFLASMSLHTDLNRDYLEEDQQKVAYVDTHFTGKAMDWFDSYLTDFRINDVDNQRTETRLIFSDYNHFVQKLRLTFGDIDAERMAERKLLKLQQTKTVAAYVSAFEQLANKVQDWGERGLMTRFYEGLKSDIRYEMIRMEKPTTLSALIKQAVQVDDELFLWKQDNKGGNGHGANSRARAAFTTIISAPKPSAMSFINVLGVRPAASGGK